MATLLQLRRLTSKKVIVFTLLILIAIYAFVTFFSSGRDSSGKSRRLRMSSLLRRAGNDSNNKVILFYVPFFGSADYHFGLGQQPFIERRCKVNRCETTTDRERLLESDAVIFHPYDFHLDTDPLPTAERDPNQRWIFHISESADHLNIDWNRMRGVFNWTTCYRTDCDVYHPYMRVLKRTSTTSVARTTTTTKPIKRLVSWLVSNCKTKGKREEYVNELSKYIAVDTYGKCGKTCPAGPKSLCDDLVFDNYKFYLAFENSICKDYFTEKVLNALQRDIVPIVYGAADYTKVTPPHSVINVNDFASPQKLAEYLLKLDSDDIEYGKYFEWKANYQVTYFQAFCDLCEKLHQHHEPKVYDDLYDWYVTKANCKHTVQAMA